MWDFTVNTDFSQVEADEQQINLTRFNLFFPEKRDFFLENQGIFAFGDSGGAWRRRQLRGGAHEPDRRICASSSRRRIGLSDDGQALPILGGTRLSGRQGAYSIGVLNIQRARRRRRRRQRTSRHCGCGAMSWRTPDIGAVLLDKEIAGPDFNRLAGFDANFRFGRSDDERICGARPFAGGVPSPSSGNDVTTRANAGIPEPAMAVQREVHDASASGSTTKLGFIPRTGVNETNVNVNRTLRPKLASAHRFAN